ncbi:MAG: sodium-dependent transporter, partial [Reyranellaceae bacterium]
HQREGERELTKPADDAPLVSREQWGSRYGFVLATIGSAVGLGNIWRFSFVAGENGGGAFLLIYVGSVLLVGAPLVIAELALGRAARADAVSAYDHAAPRSAWIAGGWLGVAAGVLILSYYAVIAGWALKYLVGAVDGSLWRLAADAHGGFFAGFIANDWEPVAWQAAMMALTMVVVAGGVRKGIEAVNRWLMPILGLIVVGLAIHAATFPGARQGIGFLFSPDWSAFSRPEVYVAALGQAFFSLGVGMAVFITYGGYLQRQEKIPSAVAAIVAGDTLFALVAGLAIFQAVFAFGLDPAAGPELAFITLPQIFLSMPFGSLAGSAFFFLLTAAALTSMVSLLEVPVACLVARRKMRRPVAVALAGGFTAILGVPSALGFGLLERLAFSGRSILDAVDFATSNLLLPAGGALIALLVGWRWGRDRALTESDMGRRLAGRLWLLSMRYVVLAVILLILYRALAGT